MTEQRNTWLQFLTTQGAQILPGEISEVTTFQRGSGDHASTEFVAPLTGLGLIAVSGEDAATFLHNQLTNDVENLGMGEVRLAGYCSPKGRLLASFLMWRNSDAVFLALPREIQAAVQKRLQMFVLRAKAKLSDATDTAAIFGLSGHNATNALSAWFDDLPATPYAKVDSPSGTVIRLPDSGNAPRYQWITDFATAEKAWPTLTQSLNPVGAPTWRLSDIKAGIPLIVRPTQEQFVPQMINFEIIGGVNFKKGCYPGQEIVARSQYLGKLKRRMGLGSVTTQEPVAAGMEVFSSADPEQPAGMVVNAERSSDNEVGCLIEIKTAALQDGTVHLGSATGPVIRFESLPYPIPESA